MPVTLNCTFLEPVTIKEPRKMNLFLSPESEMEVVGCFNMCKAAMEKRSMKVDCGNIKIIVTGKEYDPVV